MKMLFVLFAILFQSYFSVLPTWNFLTSVNDLFQGLEHKVKHTQLMKDMAGINQMINQQKQFQEIIVGKSLTKIIIILSGMMVVVVYIVVK